MKFAVVCFSLPLLLPFNCSTFQCIAVAAAAVLLSMKTNESQFQFVAIPAVAVANGVLQFGARTLFLATFLCYAALYSLSRSFPVRSSSSFRRICS